MFARDSLESLGSDMLHWMRPVSTPVRTSLIPEPKARIVERKESGMYMLKTMKPIRLMRRALQLPYHALSLPATVPDTT